MERLVYHDHLLTLQINAILGVSNINSGHNSGFFSYWKIIMHNSRHMHEPNGENKI